MSLSQKYNVPRETIQKMVNEGVIPTSVVRYHEVYDHYKTIKSASPGRSDASIFVDMSIQMNISEASIKKIVYQMGKRS